MKNVCIIGLGYIGLPTAVVAAKAGLYVTGFDINKVLIQEIKNKSLNISEPGLLSDLEEVLKSGNLVLSSEPIVADIYVVCVPTPVDFVGNLGKPNLTFVDSAVQSFIPLLQNDALVIIESTCPVGTTSQISEKIRTQRPDLLNINIAYCPERILPGNALFEITHNNRIVGGINYDSAKMAKDFYKCFVDAEIKISDAKTAEMCKLVENSFRDVNIAFANEISMVAAELRINVNELIDLANMHPRVSILKPGVGVGGHCLPIDPWFLINQTKAPTDILRIARKVNKRKTTWTANQIIAIIERYERENNRSPRVALLGATYKPDTEDYRESPALDVFLMVEEQKDLICLVDPYLEDLNEKIELISLETALDECDIFIMLVPHEKFISNELLKKKAGSLHTFC